MMLEGQISKEVSMSGPDGIKITFIATLRIDSPIEVDYYKNGGVLHTVLREMVKN